MNIETSQYNEIKKDGRSHLAYSKTREKRPLSKRPKIRFQDQLLLNAGQRYCRMLQWEHSAILLTSIKLRFVIKIFVLSFLSGRLTPVLLYFMDMVDIYIENTR